MAKKTTGKSAPKSKATPKAGQSATGQKKAGKPSASKASKPKKVPAKPKYPDWLKPFPVDYCVGTEDYAKVVETHNELFGTAWLKHRVKPAVFHDIHANVWKHYRDKD